jgi:hypothetical protein
VFVSENTETGSYQNAYFQISVTSYFPDDPGAWDGGVPAPQIVLNTVYLPTNYTETRLNSSSSVKTLVSRSCTLFGGIVSYNITLQNQTVELASDDYLADEFQESL